jgi:hypothetical protein
LQFEVSSVRSERACAQPSDFRLHTSNSRSTPPRGCVQNEANFGQPSVKRAKRTQFRPPGAGGGGKMRKTNPIWPRRTWSTRTGVSGAKSQVSSQEGPPARPLTSPSKPQASHFPTGNCAKQSQFRPRAREWVLAGGARCPAGERLCETKPIRGVNPLPNAGHMLRREVGGENVGVSRVLELS